MQDSVLSVKYSFVSWLCHMCITSQNGRCSGVWLQNNIYFSCEMLFHVYLYFQIITDKIICVSEGLFELKYGNSCLREGENLVKGDVKS